MSKIKIYELAKELDKPSKELVEFLNKKDVEAKTHMSTIDEAEADMVRKAFAPKANAEKAEEEKSDAPKKKKIVQVSARRTPRVVEDRVESVRVRDVTTDAITVLRLDVMIREITVQTVEIKMENPRMDAKK